MMCTKIFRTIEIKKKKTIYFTQLQLKTMFFNIIAHALKKYQYCNQHF